MGRITELRLGNVRCFDGEQSVKTRRITLLVGENNAGKSTVLGCYQALAKIANLDYPNGNNDFDYAPFYMGTFDTIVRSGNPNFTIGGSFEGHCHTNVMCTFRAKKNNVPIEKKIQLGFMGTGNKNQILDIEVVGNSKVLRLKGPNFCFDLDHGEISYASILKWLSTYVRHGHLPYRGELRDFKTRSSSIKFDKEAAAFAKLISFLRSELPLPNQTSFYVKALDPTLPSRTRTYLSLPRNLTIVSKDNADYLAQIGKKLMLWEDIEIQINSERSFEVLVKTPDGWRNLVDIGYGIHGLLPLFSTMLGQKRGTIFLLQQPEVHLHPSAQANLAQLLAQSEHEFLIETHSDHFIDRFRICVMQGVLQPTELSIVYFDLSPDGKSSRIHNIGVDADGNLLNVPNGYRSFFMDETKRLLGFQ